MAKSIIRVMLSSRCMDAFPAGSKTNLTDLRKELIHGFVISAEYGHIAPCVALLMRSGKKLCNLGWLVFVRGQAHDQWLLSIATATDWLHQWDAIIVLRIGLQELCCNTVGDLQDLLCIAVVDLENGGAA